MAPLESIIRWCPCASCSKFLRSVHVESRTFLFQYSQSPSGRYSTVAPRFVAQIHVAPCSTTFISNIFTILFSFRNMEQAPYDYFLHSIYVFFYIYINTLELKNLQKRRNDKTRAFFAKPDVLKFAVLMLKREINRIILFQHIPAFLATTPQQTCGWETLGVSSASS